MLKLNIQKWGNSAGVRLPSSILAQLGAKVGDSLSVSVSGDKAVLCLAKPHYTLKELLAQCDEKAFPPKLEWWDELKPVGQEVW